MKISHLIYRIAHAYAGGVVALASDMGRGEKVLSSKLNPNTETHHLNIEELDMLADFASANLVVAEYFADKANAVVVELPTDELTSDMSLLDGFMQSTASNGEFAASFIDAFGDGSVTTKEFEALRVKLYKNISTQLSFLNKIERVVR